MKSLTGKSEGMPHSPHTMTKQKETERCEKCEYSHKMADYNNVEIECDCPCHHTPHTEMDWEANIENFFRRLKNGHVECVPENIIAFITHLLEKEYKHGMRDYAVLAAHALVAQKKQILEIVKGSRLIICAAGHGKPMFECDECYVRQENNKTVADLTERIQNL